MEKQYKTFSEFYPYYLTEHRRKGTRILHFTGTSLFFVFLILTAITGKTIFLAPTIVVPYAFAWVGHFFIEKNKPATFQYPFFSLVSDFKLYFEIISGKQNWGE